MVCKINGPDSHLLFTQIATALRSCCLPGIEQTDARIRNSRKEHHKSSEALLSLFGFPLRGWPPTLSTQRRRCAHTWISWPQIRCGLTPSQTVSIIHTNAHNRCLHTARSQTVSVETGHAEPSGRVCSSLISPRVWCN